MIDNEHLVAHQVCFYTDGAWSSKSQMGGWASIYVKDGEILDIKKGWEPYSTNNRMELRAFLAALEYINSLSTIDDNTDFAIYTDSAYIANCINDKWYLKWMKNGWRTSDRQEVKNQDLWTRIVMLYIKIRGKFQSKPLTVNKVKSHTKNQDAHSLFNKMADKIAVECRKELEVED